MVFLVSPSIWTILLEKGAAQPRPNPIVAVPSHITTLRFAPGIASPGRPALVLNRRKSPY